MNANFFLRRNRLFLAMAYKRWVQNENWNERQPKWPFKACSLIESATHHRARKTLRIESLDKDNIQRWSLRYWKLQASYFPFYRVRLQKELASKHWLSIFLKCIDKLGLICINLHQLFDIISIQIVNWNKEVRLRRGHWTTLTLILWTSEA